MNEVGRLTQVAGFAEALQQGSFIRKGEIHLLPLFIKLLFGTAKKLAAVFLLLIQYFL